MERWKGLVALVTGASSGIGAELCRKLVKHGMVVVGCARNVQKISDIALEEDIKSSSGRLVAIKCDVSSEAELLSLFEDIRKKVGRLDVCINNAGLSHDSPLLSGKTNDWKNMLDVNVIGLSVCTREAVKLMQEKGVEDGHIIHISSMAGHRIPPQGSGTHFYCGTKYMVRALTEGLRRELKEANSKIRISSISPGVVKTEFFPRFYKNEPAKAEKTYSSMECIQPRDIADTVIYILGTPVHVEIHDILVRPRDQLI